MKVRIDHRRTITPADVAAVALLREGFARLKARKVSSALDGAKSKSCEAGCADSASVNLGNHESASQGLDETQ